MINSRGRVFSEAGTSEKKKYHAAYDDDGSVMLVDDGVEDLYSYIQSFASSVDIHVILKRFANGDASALSKTQGIYADVTGMPRTYAELLNTVNDLERRFAELPVDIRDKFGNSFARYAAMIGTDDYFKALGIEQSHDVAPELPKVDLEKEVIVGEQKS